ncbi:hypothetical protein TNCV_3830791 [Trichonephila clavipes]|nr:hypothetical protein TNCV_3830791 [Trichonephila clavipes]
MHVKSVGAQTCSPVGVVRKLGEGGACAQVSSSSLDHVSEFPGPQLKALVARQPRVGLGLLKKLPEGRFVLGTFRSERMQVLNRSRQNDRLRVMLVLIHIDITPPQSLFHASLLPPSSQN